MVKKNTTPPELAKQRADRIKRVREILRLSRSQLAAQYKKFGLTYSSLKNWEDIKWHGLTESGATILAKAFQEHGIHVTVEWLMFGIGDDPTSSLLKQNIKLSETAIIAKEIKFFHENNSNAVDTIITDDALEPYLKAGDYVAGIRYFANDIERAIGHPSIVQIENGQQLVRVVTAGDDVELYTLTCSNPNSVTAPKIFKNIKLLSAAPILWIRKLEVKK